jgi:hypothetical protein
MSMRHALQLGQRQQATHIDNLLEDGAELEGQGVSLLLQQRMAFLCSQKTVKGEERRVDALDAQHLLLLFLFFFFFFHSHSLDRTSSACPPPHHCIRCRVYLRCPAPGLHNGLRPAAQRAMSQG